MRCYPFLGVISPVLSVAQIVAGSGVASSTPVPLAKILEA